MANIFGNVPPPRSNYDPVEYNDSTMRRYATGAAIAQRTRQQNMEQEQQNYERAKYEQQRAAKFAAIDNLTSQMREHGVTDYQSMVDFSAKNPGYLLNPYTSKEMQGLIQNFDAVEKIKQSAEKESIDGQLRKKAVDTLSEMYQYAPWVIASARKAFDDAGNPTEEFGQIVANVQPQREAWLREKSALSPTVQAQQLRSETQQSISDEANATRLKIAEMKIGNKSVDPEVNRRMYLLNHLRLREMNADLEAVKSQEALAIKLPTEKKRNEAMSAVNASREQTMNKWRGIMDDLEKSSSQATNAAPSNGPSQTDIDYLKSNPSVKDKFNLRFGSGTAEQYLGQ